MKILRIGSRGPEVAALQSALGLEADGVFGPATDAAVRAFQRSHGLAVDGIAGGQTLGQIRDGGRALSGEQIAQAAAELGIDEPSMRAVIQVESAGSGFLSDGRPKILFERHVMFRQLVAIGREPGLLQPHLPHIINMSSGGYLGGSAEYDRLRLAKQIDPECAIESASWGLFQIMGHHWRALGYASAAEYEQRMRRGEHDHLEAFVRFVKADQSLHAALRDRRWADFARLYNGPAYAKNSYDVRLADAYQALSK